MKKRMAIMLIAVGLLMGGLIGFNLFKQAMIRKYMAASAAPPATVSAMAARYQPWQPQLTAFASLRAERGVDIASEVSGVVRRVHFRNGGRVRAGELLVELDADAEIAQLHSLEAAADLADSVYRRDRQQFEAQAVSQAQIDGDAADLRSKRALAAQEAATIAKKRIRAPFAGRLGISTLNPGQYVNPGDRIVSLQETDRVEADFYLPQRDLSRVAVGQAVAVTSDALPGRRFEGRVRAVNPVVDSDTRNFEVEARIDNPRHELLGGMYVNVALDVGAEERRLTLPRTAVTYNPYGATVFVGRDTGRKDGKGRPILEAHQVFVTTGPTRGDQVAIEKGIEEGALVVTSGQLKLKNGAPMVVDNSVQPADNPSPTPQER